MSKVKQGIIAAIATILILAVGVGSYFAYQWFNNNATNYASTFTDTNAAYASAAVLNEDGSVTFNKADDDEYSYSASSYFGEEDKNYDYDGSLFHVEFTLDLSTMEENDYTIWVLSFNKCTEDVYSHVDEIRIGIAKTADGYYVSELNGVSWSSADLDAILSSEYSFTEDKITIVFRFTYSESTLDYMFIVNDSIEISNSKSETEDIVGLRALWNAATTVSGITLSNLYLW